MKLDLCKCGIHNYEKIDTFKETIKEVGEATTTTFSYREVDEGFILKCKKCNKKKKQVTERKTIKTWFS